MPEHRGSLTSYRTSHRQPEGTKPYLFAIGGGSLFAIHAECEVSAQYLHPIYTISTQYLPYLPGVQPEDGPVELHSQHDDQEVALCRGHGGQPALRHGGVRLHQRPGLSRVLQPTDQQSRELMCNKDINRYDHYSVDGHIPDGHQALLSGRRGHGRSHLLLRGLRRPVLPVHRGEVRLLLSTDYNDADVQV